MRKERQPKEEEEEKDEEEEDEEEMEEKEEEKKEESVNPTYAEFLCACAVSFSARSSSS